jgi:ankyrin repeat protein
MDTRPLAFSASLSQYERQATELLEIYQANGSAALVFFRKHHPRFRDPKIAWLARDVTDAEVRDAGFNLADAQIALARWYDFRDWAALAEYSGTAARPGSPVFRFESAVEAVIDGDLPTLRRLLKSDPDLVRARSNRINFFDPPVHRATLLHYIAANGVEGYRQRTPANAVDVARTLLEAGAEVDALADMYGGQCTTMSMLVSSSHPAEAGLQVALANTLIDFGASVEPQGSKLWGSPLMTALAFGFQETAEALVRRGARVENVAAAAGLGRTADAARLLPTADAESRHRAMALAAQLGHVEIVRLLLDAGEDPNRYNPEGNHAHSTPLHQASLSGHLGVVRLLVERGARLDIKDTIWHGTPLGWALHNRQEKVASYLREHGAA